MDRRFLGDNVTIADNVVLSRFVIGDNTKITQGLEILGSVLWSNVTIGQESRIKENVIGTSTKIDDRVVFQVEIIVADEYIIGTGAVVS
jgi:NDP-sugar pyrophosphorylase family protein